MPLITDDIRNTAKAALDSLLAPPEEGGLGKHCRLLFPPKKVPCPNCLWDYQNKRSADQYRAGGPQPFPKGTPCPVCHGKGTLDTEVSQDIVMGINWSPKTWVSMPGIDSQNVNVEVPGGMCQAKGFLKDLPRILQSRKMIIQTPIEGIQQFTYVLFGQPVDAGNIIQGHYVYTMWKAAGT